MQHVLASKRTNEVHSCVFRSMFELPQEQMRFILLFYATLVNSNRFDNGVVCI